MTESAVELARQTRSFNVLLVDDAKVVADVFSMILREMGHHVTVAKSAHEALEILETRDPHIIISDISMPRMNGYEFAQHLRSQRRFDGILLVATTGMSLPEDRQRALEAGFDEHLVKPPDMATLERLFQDAASRLCE